MQTTTQITVTVNGTRWTIHPGAALTTLLQEKGIDTDHPRGVAVAVNDSVVRKTNWSSQQLEEGDRIEIVTAKQGG